jgi:hypothetical protein
MQLLAHQQVQIHLAPPGPAQPATSVPLLTRAQRAHYRLSWVERLARNARASTEGPVRIKQIARPRSLEHVPWPPHKLAGPDRW